MSKNDAGAIGAFETTAEWALRGKESHDREYRVLAWSKAQLSEENFAQYLQRYETGTLAMLPEVTVSWCSDKMSNSYLGIAMHRKPAEAKYDAAGREFMETSLFCLDYGELAPRAVSYTSMYLGLRDCMLPPEESGWPITRTGRRIVAQLPAGDFSGTPRPLAVSAAVSMLARRTVCVLGADRASLDERLRFLDEVAAVLPYGMRSRLSASTLTSSTYKTHNIRLFFANSPRGGQDVILTWSDEVPSPVGLGALEKYLEKYLDWFYKDPQASVHRLAKMTTQIGFNEAHVAEVIRELGLGDDPPSTQPMVRHATVEELLIECGRRLNAETPESIRPPLTQLSAHVGDKPPAKLRQRYQEIVRQYQILRKDLPIADPELCVHFYNVILQVAFGAPITYDIYCAVEDSLENQESWELHYLLAKAVYGLWGEDLRTQLIVLYAIGSNYLTHALAARTPLTAEYLIQMTLDAETQLHHRHLIYLIVMGELERRAAAHKPGELQKIFAARGYLVASLYEFYSQDFGEQLHQLKRIFRLSFGDVMPSGLGRDILGEESVLVTPALGAAVVQMADSQEMTQLFWDLAFAYVVPSFAGEIQEDLIRKFEVARPQGIEKPKRAIKKPSRQGRRTWRPRSKLDHFGVLIILACLGFIAYLILKLVR